MFKKKTEKKVEVDHGLALLAAIKAKDLSGVERILASEVRASINLNDKHVYMHVAVEESTPEILSALLQAGGDPRTPYSVFSTVYAQEALTPLRYAIEKDKIEMARVLLSDPRSEDVDFRPLKRIYNQDTPWLDYSARDLAKSLNRGSAWDDLFDLAEARRFMTKFQKAQEILAQHGEWPPKPAAAKPRPLNP